MHHEVKLCKVKSKEHEESLSEIAKWLDDNKFSCTLSIINEIAYLDIDSDSYWFVEHVTQEVLTALADRI
jgi:hypothetical protein